MPTSSSAPWVPAVDIHEYPDRFELYLDVPGVDPNEVELALEDAVVALLRAPRRDPDCRSASPRANAPGHRHPPQSP